MEWLEERRKGGNPDPAFHCQDLPQGVISAARTVKDRKDGSTAIELSVRAVHYENRPRDDDKPDGAVKPVRRFWDPEAALLIRLALANGGTMHISKDREDTAGDSGEDWRYPRVYASGVQLHRVFMDARFGQLVYAHKNLTRPFRHRDCRRRHLFIRQWPGSGRIRGVRGFLRAAEEAFLKRNPLDDLTGPERFAISARRYSLLLKDVLQVLARFNPSASPEQAEAWFKARKAYGGTNRVHPLFRSEETY